MTSMEEGVVTDAVYTVRLHGTHVGTIQQRDRFTVFAFDRDYWARPERCVLGLWFEDHPRERPRAVNAVPAWFSNLLPEGPLRELIAREQGVSPYREMELLARIGEDLPGAVTVVADLEAGVDADFSEPREVAPRPRGTGAPAMRRASLAGMALKYSMSLHGGRMVVPAHGEDGDWILKTPDASYPQLPANEYAVMGLAREVGIEVPQIAVWERESVDDLGEGAWCSEETTAYAIRRFDRSPGGRIHIEDFAQVLGRSGAGEGKYGSTVETVAGLSYRGQDSSSLREMVRRSTFNLLVGNGDAHLKNWSLIYDDGRHARLSPAYDLVCTAAYQGLTELGLPFFGATRITDVGREHFERLQELLQVPDADVLDAVDETVERFRDAWAAGAVEPLMPDEVRAWIGAHLEPTSRRLTRSGGGTR